MRSRVMPGSSPTIERRLRVSRLNSVDFPTFGRPTIATSGSAPAFVDTAPNCFRVLANPRSTRQLRQLIVSRSVKPFIHPHHANDLDRRTILRSFSRLSDEAADNVSEEDLP